MTPERWRRIDELCDVARQLNPAARESWLVRACGADADLRAEIDRLLAGHEQADRDRFPRQPEGPTLAPEPGTTERPAPERPAEVDCQLAAAAGGDMLLEVPTGTVTPPHPVAEGPGVTIGSYKLLQRLGEGGYGIVYMAEQNKPVHRGVALKIIKPGMDSSQVIARFEAEKQALAMMDHPNIAKVFDAGTTDSGRPFFVMELVHGVPITRYCDENHLTVRERLELVVPVCKAVQHAHQKGIIHRDLKPSNVLVCLSDGHPVPKVIDFGVAKAVEQRLTERTMFTQFGQIIGTFEYMSPEQAEMSQLGVDTRSDIYSLGVMIYELLTGSTPLERQRVRAAGLDEMLKMIKEEEPPKPSMRLSELSRSGAPSRTAGARQAGSTELARIAAARRTEPLKLSPLMRGELDWVVMKCLEKDRARRYDTANGLARDIERYLHEEPVEAGPPGAGYRLRKLARKHRAALGITGLIAVLLVLAGTVSAWQAVRATLAERWALAERDRAEQEKDRAEQEKDRAEQEKDRAETSFRMARETVDRFFTQVGESPKLKAHGMEKFRKDLLQNAKEFYERFIRERLDAPEVRQELGLAHVRLAKIHQTLGDFAGAQTSSEKAIEILSELARAQPRVADYQSDLAASHFELGAVFFNTGRFDETEAAYKQSLVIQSKLAADHPVVTEYLRALARTQHALGRLFLRAGQYDKAHESLEKGLEIWSQLVENKAHVPEDRHGLASVQLTLGSAYGARGQSEKSEAMLKAAASTYQALVALCPDVPEYRNSLGRAYRALGGRYFVVRQARKAEAAHQQSLQIYEKLVQEHPDMWEYAYQMGRCYYNLALDAQLERRWDAVLSNDEKAIEILEHLVDSGYGQVRSDLFDASLLLATMLAGRGEHARATDDASAVARQEGVGQVNYYNIACVFAVSSAAAENDGKLAPADRTRLKAQYADRAMEFLRQAVALGYQEIPQLNGDPELASLRSREDFQKLVRDVERKSRK
jgi:serine/threonine protein kinase/tetratricopeptide (TPR) repeat protein